MASCANTRYWVTLSNGEKIDKKTFKTLAGARRHRRNVEDFNRRSHLKIHRMRGDTEERWMGVENGREIWSEVTVSK